MLNISSKIQNAVIRLLPRAEVGKQQVTGQTLAATCFCVTHEL